MKFLEFVRAIAWTVGVWVSLICIFFVNYNWEIFSQFVKNFSLETAITLLIPTFVAGIIARAKWPRKKRS